MIEQKRQAGALQPHRGSLASRLNTLLRRTNQDQTESGLYMVGSGPKATYWYWEVNHEEGYFQTIETPSVAECDSVRRETRLHQQQGIVDRKTSKHWFVSKKTGSTS